MQSIPVFLDITKAADFQWWCQQNSRGEARDLYIFLFLFMEGIALPSFIILGYVWQILGRKAFLALLSMGSPEKAHPEYG